MIKTTKELGFLDALPRHSDIMTGRGSNIFDECAARYVHLSLQEQKHSGDSKINTSESIPNSKRMPTKINKTVAIAKF